MIRRYTFRKKNLIKKVASWMKSHFLPFVIAFLTLIAAYVVYLDAQIKPHFSGNKWQVPAQVYARPLTFAVKEEISQKEIIDELKLLGYRRQRTVESVGEYAVGQTSVVVYRRAFDFADGYASEQYVRIRWEDTRIASITDLATNQSLLQLRFEPWLVTRLVSGNREDRMLITLDDIPPLLVEALVLVEDKDFYTHWGVNPLAIARALLANISAGRKVQGGSTLTQQLVKNLYLSREQSYTRKVKEALMALIIDARYSKDAIIQAYLNEVFVGQNGGKAVHGFGLGSHFYFDRPINELNLPEMATLVGMLKGPSYYNPKRAPERTQERRDLVLRILFEADKIDKATYLDAINQPLKVAAGDSLASGQHPAFMDQVSRELSNVLADPDIRQSGLKVFTTLDINAQRRAEKALSQRVKNLAKARNISALQGAMVLSDIRSGGIRAIIGDAVPDTKGFNRALDARRSIGSLVKPAIYYNALRDASHYQLASIIPDAPIVMEDERGKRWAPQNADKQFRGEVRLLDALTSSYNLPAVQVALDTGIDNLVATLAELGIDEPVPSLPAIALGAINLSALQVNQMYQTLANEGVYRPLHTVSAILSPRNQLLWAHSDYSEQRIDRQVAYLLNYALHKVTKEGTARQVGKRFKGINLAGKTGTTNDYRDSWFAGFDRNLLASIWVGDDNNAQTGLSGSSGAMQVYIDFQAQMEPKSLSRRFPKGLEIAHFSAQTGAQMQAGCPGSVSLPAISSELSQQVLSCSGNVVAKPKPIQPKKKAWWERIFG